MSIVPTIVTLADLPRFVDTTTTLTGPLPDITDLIYPPIIRKEPAPLLFLTETGPDCDLLYPSHFLMMCTPERSHY